MGDTRRWNHFTCERCGGVTVALNEDDGETPDSIRCRATLRCGGDAQTSDYQGSQDDAQIPHVIWFMPRDDEARFLELGQMKFLKQMTARDQVKAGGLSLRYGPAMPAEKRM